MKKYFLPIIISIFCLNEAQAVIYYVTSNHSTGIGSLGEAILLANANPGRDSIYFNLPDSSVTGRTIMIEEVSVDSLLPNISEEVVIDGTTQPTGGYFGITAAKIRISADTYVSSALAINAPACEIYGLWISHFTTGVKVISADNVAFGKVNNGNVITDCTSVLLKFSDCQEGSVVGCFIGIDTSGTVGTSPAATGILLEASTKKMTIGGKSDNGRNIISGNSVGIKVNDSKFINIQDCFVGTDFSGTLAVPNSTGILVDEACDNITMGGDSIKYMNVISGNLERGIDFEGLTSFIIGNMIGCDVSGTQPLGNGNYGVYMRNLANDTSIGDTIPGKGNVIAYNGAEGVYFESLLVKNIYIRGNRMFCNSQFTGIGGINVNGGNQQLAAPTIAILSDIFISGSTYPNVIVDIYSADSCTTCEGNDYLTSVQADGNGIFSANMTITGKVTVTANDPYGNTSQFAECKDTSNTSCILASFFASDDKVCTNEDIGLLDQTITDPNSTVVSWLWELGDGQTSTLQDPIISYDTGGVYTLILTATNDDGCEDSASTIITVEDGVLPSFSADTNVCLGSAVHFIDESEAQGSSYIISWFWDLGDNSTSTFTDFFHTYDSVGSFTVKLEVVNNNNCVAFHNETIVVHDFPKAIFSVAPDACAVTPVQFTDFSNPAFGADITSWFWDFGDGATSTAQNPSHLFTASGDYMIQLTVTDEFGCSDDTLAIMSIVSGAIANFEWTQGGLTVNFDNTSTLNSDFQVQWDFGDGSISNLFNPSHTYSTFGSYDVCLIVNDYTCDMSDTLCKNVLLTGIHDASNYLSHVIQLSPNPAVDYIQLKNIPASYLGISMHNSVGQEILLSQPPHAPSTGEFILTLPLLPDGLYWITVLTEEGMANKKVIISGK